MNRVRDAPPYEVNYLTCLTCCGEIKINLSGGVLKGGGDLMGSDGGEACPLDRHVFICGTYDLKGLLTDEFSFPVKICGNGDERRLFGEFFYQGNDIFLGRFFNGSRIDKFGGVFTSERQLLYPGSKSISTTWPPRSPRVTVSSNR